jgi:hypothetical protein
VLDYLKHNILLEAGELMAVGMLKELLDGTDMDILKAGI